MIKKITLLSFSFLILLTGFLSCSKSNDVAGPGDPCAGKTILVSTAVVPASSPSLTDGSITVTATGSTGFSYSLNGGPYQSSATFNSLAPGNYSVTAKDAAGCVKAASCTITANSCPAITVTATVTSTTGTANNGSVSATASGSTGFTYSLNGGAFQANGNFTGLAAGTYTVTVKDGNGCTGSGTFVVNSAACATITVTCTATPASGPTATNGSVSVSASGGTAPYTFSINGGAGQANSTFGSLATGNYTVVVTDANGCSGTAAVTVGSNCPALTVSGSATPSDKCTNNTGVITVTATGSSGYTYSLNGGSYQPNNVFSNLAAGNFTISARDLNGCTASSGVNVAIAPAGVAFNAVKTVLANNCALSGCHAGPSPQNGINFSDDCTIVSQSARIKARAVDGNPSFMPPSTQLSAADKQKITDWINAGGQHSNN